MSINKVETLDDPNKKSIGLIEGLALPMLDLINRLIALQIYDRKHLSIDNNGSIVDTIKLFEHKVLMKLKF